jgi:hypothetical protein
MHVVSRYAGEDGGKQASERGEEPSSEEYRVQQTYWRAEHFGEVPGSTRAKV